MLMQNIFSQFQNKETRKLLATDHNLLNECAALSLDVYYDDNDPSRPVLPLGWKKLLSSDKYLDGYFGALYVNNSVHPMRIIFAHRGTVLTGVGNLIGALEIALNQVPLQFNSAKEFAFKGVDQ